MNTMMRMTAALILTVCATAAEPEYIGPIGQLGKDAFRHDASVEYLLISNDGERLRAFLSDGKLVEWDCKTRKRIRRVDFDQDDQDSDNVAEVFADSSKDVVFVEHYAANTGAAVLYRIALGKDDHAVRTRLMESSCDFSVLNGRVARLNQPGVWEVQELKDGGRTFKGDRRYESDTVVAFSLCSRGNLLLAGDWDDGGTLIGWEVDKQARLWTRNGHDARIISSNPAMNRALVAVCGEDDDGLLIYLDAMTGKTIWKRELTFDPLKIIWSPNGKRVVVLGSSDIILDEKTGKTLASFECAETPRAGVFSKDGTKFYLPVGTMVFEYSADGKRIYPEPGKDPLTVQPRQFFVNTKTDELIHASSFVGCLDVKTGSTKPWTLDCTGAQIIQSPAQDKFLVVGSRRNKEKETVAGVWVFDAKSKKLLAERLAPEDFEYQCANFSMDGRSVYHSFASDEQGVVGKLDLKTGKSIRLAKVNPGLAAEPIEGVIPIASDAGLICIAGESIMVWMPALGKEFKVLDHANTYYWHGILLGRSKPARPRSRRPRAG
jgi:outer membrane protein assembly factor BamB